MITNQRNLRQLSLSGNKLSSQQLTQLISSLKESGSIEDLDLSMSKFNGDQAVFKELADFIGTNKQLKTLIL